MLFWGTSCDNRIECHEAYDEKNCSTKLRSIYVVAFLVLFVLLYVLGKDKIWLRWIIKGETFSFSEITKCIKHWFYPKFKVKIISLKCVDKAVNDEDNQFEMVSLETHQETFDAFENNHNDNNYSHVLNTELFRQDFKIKTSLKAQKLRIILKRYRHKSLILTNYSFCGHYYREPEWL